MFLTVLTHLWWNLEMLPWKSPLYFSTALQTSAQPCWQHRWIPAVSLNIPYAGHWGHSPEHMLCGPCGQGDPCEWFLTQGWLDSGSWRTQKTSHSSQPIADIGCLGMLTNGLSTERRELATAFVMWLGDVWSRVLRLNGLYTFRASVMLEAGGKKWGDNLRDHAQKGGTQATLGSLGPWISTYSGSL